VEHALEITHDLDPDGRTVLTLRGEIDIATAPRLRAAIGTSLPASEGMVLDVSGAVLIDAAGLRVLTAAQREAAALGKAPIVLRGVRPLFAKTLHITGLDHLFTREPALAPTLAAVGGPRSARRTSRPARTPRPAVRHETPVAAQRGLATAA
jgi:anti-sigma B factor antagonist